MPEVETLTVPYVDLVTQHAPLRRELLAACARVLEHGRFILGPEVEELEQRWATLCGTRQAVGVSNATMGLLLLLKALDIGPGDEVITAPNSFLASASPIALAGATPVFADVGEDFNLAPESVRTRVTSSTKAIIAVHLAGRPADMDALNQLAEERGLVVLEDAAQAMGARYRGRPAGSLGRAACFSLHPLKTVAGCGDGGVITTDDEDLAESLRRWRNHGLAQRQEDCAFWAYNARLDTMQAAFTLVKLPHLDAWIHTRREHAAHYRHRLGRLAQIPPDHPDDHVGYHTFPIAVERRDELAEYLQARGIGCAVHYRKQIHQLEPALPLGYQPGDLPQTEDLAGRVLSLPIHQDLTADQIDAVCEAVEQFYHLRAHPSG